MTDLPFDFSTTLDAFECPEPIEVYEKSGSYVNGRWAEVEQNHRSLYCILLNVDETKQEIVAQGRKVVGAYCVMFPDGQDELYFSWQQNENLQGLQSFLVIDGF